MSFLKKLKAVKASEDDDFTKLASDMLKFIKQVHKEQADHGDHGDAEYIQTAEDLIDRAKKFSI